MNRHWCGASSCAHLGSCPVYPEISILLVVPGNIFYERSKVDDNGKRVYPDASECAKHAGILASRMEEGTIRPTACPGLANDIVSVVTGLLYDERDHFHLQVQASCIVPTRNEVSAFAEATTCWKATAPFNGIPFRANLTPKEIQLVLAAFAERTRVAVTVIEIPKMGKMPAVMLIGADPVSVATAINTAAEVPENWEPENKRQPARPKPTHGKFGYNFSWHDTNTDMSVSVLHPGLQDLLQQDSDLHSLLEACHHLASHGTDLTTLSFFVPLVMYRPAPFVLHVTERNQQIYISLVSRAGCSHSPGRYSCPFHLRS